MDDRAHRPHAYDPDVAGDGIVVDPAATAAARARFTPAGPEPASDAPADAGDTAPTRSTGQRLRGPLLLGGLIVLLVAGLFFYLHGGRYESTDNAQLQAGQVAVAANVSGPVIAIGVRENQAVTAGQILFRIDPAPYQAAVDEAAAQLADARAQISTRRASFREGQAGVGTAQAQLNYAVGEAARQKALFAEGISSQNQYAQAVLAVQTARQAIQTSSEQLEGVRAALSGDAAAPTDVQPAVKRAEAVLARARLNLSYATVRAPQDGIVTRVNQLQLGSYVTVARPVFTLVGKRIWVEANFKESQLRYIRIGQPATVTIDAYPGHDLRARVTSFSPGTGNSFSLLPPENATGNWVKVVQRLPIELTLDAAPADLPLHAGLSADVSVDTGHVRHLFGADTVAPPAPPAAAPAAG